MNFYTQDFQHGWIIHNSQGKSTVVAIYDKVVRPLVPVERNAAEKLGFETVRFKAISFEPNNSWIIAHPGQMLLFGWNRYHNTLSSLNHNDELLAKQMEINTRWACFPPSNYPAPSNYSSVPEDPIRSSSYPLPTPDQHVPIPQPLPVPTLYPQAPILQPSPKKEVKVQKTEKEGIYKNLETNLAVGEGQEKGHYEIIGKFNDDDELINQITVEDYEYASKTGFIIGDVEIETPDGIPVVNQTQLGEPN